MLVGNPNCGKTTLFNLLTGAGQPVGNFSGVTVSEKTGCLKKDRGILLTDLPGTYSLQPYSAEEKITEKMLAAGQPDFFINVVDGQQLVRSLYLTLQLLALYRPVILVVNMADELEDAGVTLRPEVLRRKLGIPVVPVSAKRGTGIAALEELIQKQERKTEKQAVQLLFPKQQAFSAALVQKRYAMLESLVRSALIRPKAKQRTKTEKLDRILLHPVFAFPILLLLLGFVFFLTFGPLGELLCAAAEGLQEQLGAGVRFLCQSQNAPEWAASLLSDALVGGVGSVLVYLPRIALLFCCLSLLEESGYLARAAFLTDRLLQKLGLSGRSFVPLFMGFGCTTPAVLATRTLDRSAERKQTVCMIPFLACGARLPVLLLLSSLVCKNAGGLLVVLLYLFCVLLCLLVGLFLSRYRQEKQPPPFVLELPPYRLPGVRDTLLHTWKKTRDFLTRAGTLIFAFSVVIWLLRHLTPAFGWTTMPRESLFGLAGRYLAPLFEPLGFGFWQATMALLGGLIAKEAIISTLAVLAADPAGGGTIGLEAALSGWFSPLSALSFCVFCLLYIPCFSALITISQELNSRTKTVLLVLGQFAVSYLVSFFVYQIGMLLGFGR